MFREIREVKSEEKLTNKKEENFRKIKPESSMTFSELNKFWEEEFKKMAES